MKGMFLKRHEFKALDRALDAAIKKYLESPNWPSSDVFDPNVKKEIINEALRIVQFRARRFYSDAAQKEARDYLNSIFCD